MGSRGSRLGATGHVVLSLVFPSLEGFMLSVDRLHQFPLTGMLSKA